MWSCFRPKRAIHGCSTPPITSLPALRATETQRRFTSRKPTNFAIGGKGGYQIDGDAFVYVDHTPSYHHHPRLAIRRLASGGLFGKFQTLLAHKVKKTTLELLSITMAEGSSRSIGERFC